MVIGASRAAVFSFKSMFDTPENEDKDAGFMVVYKQVLHRHKNCNFVALELKTKDKQAIKDMFKKWTQMSVNMTDGAL